MSTPSHPPALEAPRQLTVPLPLEFDPEEYASYQGFSFASSGTHLALGCKNSVWIYSLPAFDLIDTINPGNLTQALNVPLQIHERFLVVILDSEDGYFLYIWDLSARKHIGTAMRNVDYFRIFVSISLPFADIPGDSQRSLPERHRDPLLIVCSLTNGTVANLETYVLIHPDAENIDGGIERTEEILLMTPETTICPIHEVFCFGSMGRTALTGGKDGTVRAWDIIAGTCELVLIGHTGFVRRVGFDKEMIYSASNDGTVRLWDRYKGDCLHVLDVSKSDYGIKAFLPSAFNHSLPPHGSTVFILDIVSDKPEHSIDKQLYSDLGPIHGKERTLATLEADLKGTIYWFRMWDIRSGRLLTSSSFEPGPLLKEWFFQDRYFVGIDGQNGRFILRAWDFGANDSLDTEVGLGNNDKRNSRYDVTYKPEEAGKDYHGKAMVPSPSDCVVDDTLPGGSTMSMRGQRKRDKAKSFIRALPHTTRKTALNLSTSEANRPFLQRLFHLIPMSTHSPPPEAPRQFSVPLYIEDDPAFSHHSIEFASSTTHVALAFKDRVWIYRLPAFAFVGSIKPGKLSTDEPVHIYGRILVVDCISEGVEDVRLLYIWELSAQKHINTLTIRGSYSSKIFQSMSILSVDFPESGQYERIPPECHEDLLLTIASPADVGHATNLEAHILRYPDPDTAQGTIGGVHEYLLETHAMSICSIHSICCLTSMGKTALTGGEDQTIRAWDVISGKCQMVFIGHSGRVTRLCIDVERICSSSTDDTIRVWDRYSGDCLHILDFPRPTSKHLICDLFFTSPYLVITTIGNTLDPFSLNYTVFIWNIFSGTLEHEIDNQLECNLAMARGKARTLATIEHDEGLDICWFRIWDPSSGRSLRSSSFECGFLPDTFFCQGRYFIGVAEYGIGHVLKVWDFGTDDSLDSEVGNNACRSSRDEVTYKTKETSEVDHRKAMNPSPSSSVVEHTLSGGSTTSSKRKTSNTKSFIRRLIGRR
ncbi:hypothetical protein CVT26_000883 [Gymnopilus dilepis]|uniref:WD40 repeat-like protein n=1 Tax=Gymnopilus dilepis TaxID=231916 RepID=A0A409WW02_9AGAR|nr:hypothetical protein CVT26_000883 [Gymnopilus dilepis]